MAKAKLKATKKTPVKKTSKPSKAAMKAAEALVNPPELVLMRQAIEQLGKNTEMLNAMNDTLLDLATKLESQRAVAVAPPSEVKLLTEPAPVPSSPLLADSEEESDADDEDEADEVEDENIEGSGDETSEDEEDSGDTAARS